MEYLRTGTPEWRSGAGEPNGAATPDRSTSDLQRHADAGTHNGNGHHVGNLESDVGAEVYQELRTAFVANLTPQIDDLSNAAAAGDVPAARYVAHQINGTAPSFGATRLDGLADRLLALGRDQSDQLQSIVDEIAQEVAQLQRGLALDGRGLSDASRASPPAAGGRRSCVGQRCTGWLDATAAGPDDDLRRFCDALEPERRHSYAWDAIRKDWSQVQRREAGTP